jgi:hypothetical protein
MFMSEQRVSSDKTDDLWVVHRKWGFLKSSSVTDYPSTTFPNPVFIHRGPENYVVCIIYRLYFRRSTKYRDE